MNANNRTRSRRGRIWLNGIIGILGVLWLALFLPIAAFADGTETHGGPIKSVSPAVNIVSEWV